MTRQAFSDFLSTPSPSNGTRGGRGNGRGVGTPTRGRGGGRGGSRKDYSAVPPVDYSLLNKERYQKLDGFTPSPYASNPSSSTPRRGSGVAPRGSSTPRQHLTPSHSATNTPSGTQTPVYGLGFPRERGRGTGTTSSSFSRGGRGGRLGRMLDEDDRREQRVPVFVKAGAFIANEEEGKTNLVFIRQEKPDQLRTDEALVDALMDSEGDGDGNGDVGGYDDGDVDGSGEGVTADADASPLVDVIMVDPLAEDLTPSLPSETAAIIISTAEDIDLHDGVTNMTESISRMEVDVPIAQEEDAVAEDAAEDSTPLFFVDTEPYRGDDADQPVIQFDYTTEVLGDRDDVSSGEEDEEILFVPRTFAQPEPILLPISLIPCPTSSTRLSTHQYERNNPSHIAIPTRAENKASKKSKGRGTTKKQDKRAKRKGRRRTTEDVGEPRRGDSDVDWGSDGSDIEEQEDDPAMDDYASNLIARVSTSTPKDGAETEGESEAVNDDIDLEALRRFAMGFGQQVTITEIDEARKQQQEDEEEGWVDSSGSESESGEESVAVVGVVGLEANEEGDESDDSEDRDDYDAMQLEDDEDEDDDDDDEDDKYFKGKSTWADESEDFIKNIERVLDENSFMLGGTSSRKDRNKLFKSIENGDFGDDWSPVPAPKGKNSKLANIPSHLQSQWEKDRLKKAEYKRQRAEERLEASLSLYPAAKKGKGGKGKKDKGKGKAIFKYDQLAHRRSARELADEFSLDEAEAEDEDDDITSFPRNRPVTNLSILNEEIIVFLKDAGKTTMSLPAMEKFSRKRVHEIAEMYMLKSKSKGKGRGRFPILYKTTHSTHRIANPAKLLHLISTSSSMGGGSGGAFYKAKYSNTKGTPKPRLPGSASRSGVGVRHMDGDTVGGEATKIGHENIGHRLLRNMGWAEGDRIGMSGGLDVPIIAIVKNSKTGLGA